MQRDNEKTSDVLFQKLGRVWYVFSEINNDVIFTALPDGVDPTTSKVELFEIIEEHMKKISAKEGFRPQIAA